MPPKRAVEKTSAGDGNGDGTIKKRRRVVAKRSATVAVDVEGNNKYTTVKCCLAKRLRNASASLPRLEAMADHVGRVMRDGSMLVNVWLLRLLEAGQGRLPPWLDFDQSWFLQCCFAMGTPFAIQDKRMEERIGEVFRAHPALFEHRTRRVAGDTQVINQAVRGYMTNFDNHHEVHRFARAKKYMRCRLGARWKEMTKHERWQLCRFVYEDDVSALSLPTLPWMEEATQWLMELRRRFGELREAKKAKRVVCETVPKGAEQSLRLAEASSVIMRRKVEFTYWIGMRLHEHYVDSRSTAPVSSLRSNKKKAKKKAVKIDPKRPATHSIAPICAIDKASVTLTATSLKDIFDVPEGADAFDTVFKDIRTLRSVARGWTLVNVCTDGVALSVRFSKSGADPDGGAVDTCANTDETHDHQVDTDGHKRACDGACGGLCHPQADAAGSSGQGGVSLDRVRVLGGDPGIVNMMHMLEELPDGTTREYEMTTKDYYHQAFVWKFRNRMNERKDTISDIMEAMASCVKKTVVLDLQLEYWSIYALHRDVLFSTLATKERRKLAMNVYINGSKAIDAFLRSLDDGSGRPIIVIYGAGKMPVGMKGRVSPPTTSMFKRCSTTYRTILMPEQYTSQMCPRCDQQLHAKMVLHECRDGVSRMVQSRSVKRCTSPSCVLRATTYGSAYMRSAASGVDAAYEWNRDRVGAWNILKCGMAHLRGDHRPAHLDFARAVRRRNRN